MVTLNGSDCDKLLGESSSITNFDNDVINMILYIKDKHNVSASAYQIFTQVCKYNTGSYKLERRIAELNHNYVEHSTNTRVQKLIELSPSDTQFLVMKQSLEND